MKLRRPRRRVSGRDGMAIAAAAVAVLALVADLAIVRPLDEEIAAKRMAVARLTPRTQAEAQAASASPRAQLAQFHAGLPPGSEAQEVVRKLHLGARAAGLRLDRGEYRPLEPVANGLLRYQIVLPVSGSYAAVRRFIGSAMQAMPNLALEGITLRRGEGPAAPVQAELRIIAFLRPLA